MEIAFIDMLKNQPFDRRICPCCGTPTMVTIEVIKVRVPPTPTAVPSVDLTTIVINTRFSVRSFFDGLLLYCL